MSETILGICAEAWIKAHRVAGWALLNLIDDPAILAMGFC
jgi:uncharacterized protein YfiM (DUF2279 family)